MPNHACTLWRLSKFLADFGLRLTLGLCFGKAPKLLCGQVHATTRVSLEKFAHVVNGNGVGIIVDGVINISEIWGSSHHRHWSVHNGTVETVQGSVCKIRCTRSSGELILVHRSTQPLASGAQISSAWGKVFYTCNKIQSWHLLFTISAEAVCCIP